MAKDVVCGMEVDKSTAQFKTEYQGKTYYFCSPGCKAEFEKTRPSTSAGIAGVAKTSSLYFLR